eukprot:scaffold39115_cov65-Phaeocystis_antarctica.AAC.11
MTAMSRQMTLLPLLTTTTTLTAYRDEQADNRLEVAHAEVLDGQESSGLGSGSGVTPHLDGQEAQGVDRRDEAAAPHGDVVGREQVEGNAGADHLEG